MTAATPRERFGTFPDGAAVPWPTVVVVAAILSFADCFWVVSLREAAGAAIRTGRPFASWLVDSTIVLPLFVLAVLGALAVAHHRYGPALRGTRAVAVATLMVAAAGTVAGLAVAVASAAYDYYLQAGQSALVAATHGHSGAFSPGDPTCTGACAVDRATLEVHALGLAYLVPLLAATNAVLVGWLVALRGGRLDARR